MKKEGKILVSKNGPYLVSDLALSEGMIKTDKEDYSSSVEKTKD